MCLSIMSETEEPKQVKVSPWKYKIIYKWWGGSLRWVLGPALKPLMSDLITMIMETRGRINFYHGEIKKEDCKTMEEEISINTGIEPDMGGEKGE